MTEPSPTPNTRQATKTIAAASCEEKIAFSTDTVTRLQTRRLKGVLFFLQVFSHAYFIIRHFSFRLLCYLQAVHKGECDSLKYVHKCCKMLNVSWHVDKLRHRFGFRYVVLVDNVSIPTFVLTLSHAKICTANVLHMSWKCPCQVFVQYMTLWPNFCPKHIQYLSLASTFVQY